MSFLNLPIFLSRNGAYLCLKKFEMEWNNAEEQNLNYLMFNVKYRNVVKNIEMLLKKVEKMSEVITAKEMKNVEAWRHITKKKFIILLEMSWKI